MKKLRNAASVLGVSLASTALWSQAALAQSANTAPVAATHAAPAQQDSSAAAPSSQGIADIVVTATRRETSLQRVPQSISVVDGAVFKTQGRMGLEDLKVTVPNINFASTSNTTQLYIRGIGNTFINAGGDPGVALYQDGAYISDQTTSNVNFFDVARVEVLRGPQGALYGRNATGGAINVISAAPLNTLGGNVTATTGNYGRLDTDGFISGPLGVADTDVRLSFQTRHHSGYIKNLVQSSQTVPSSLDDMDSQAFRAQTRTRLPTGGTLRILATHYRENDNGAALAVVPTPGFAYPAQVLYGLVPTDNPRRVTVNEGRNRANVTNVNANLDQPLLGGTLTITGNYRRSTQSFINDCDGTPVDNCSFARDTSSKDYFGDVHFASAADNPFRWIVGATYLKFDQYQLSTVLWDAPSTYLGGTDPKVPVSLDTFVGGTVTTKSYAFYGDARLKLTDIWSLTGQVRYSKTTKHALEELIIPTFALDVRNFPNQLKDSGVPFKVGIEGQLTSTVLVYGNYATAFKDGAINLGALQTTPVRKEDVKSFEVGIKSSFFDRRLQFNAAAFHSDYKNLQISQLIGTINALVNAPKARIYGAEAELIAEPTRGLRLNASVGYLHPILREFRNAPVLPGGTGPQQNLAGKQLPYVAKWNVTAGAEYRFEPIERYTATIGTNLAFQSRTYFNEFNVIGNSQKPVSRIDLNASFGPSETSWKLFAYVRNVTNRNVLTGTTIYSPLLGAEKGVSYAPPRTIGIGASYSF